MRDEGCVYIGFCIYLCFLCLKNNEMIKIPEIALVREADAYTIANEPLASADLMERAAKACFDYIKARWKKQVAVKIFCGMGNNGGDGLALGRMLAVAGYQVSVYRIVHANDASADFIVNEKRLLKVKRATYASINETSDFPVIQPDDLVIDAMIGSGLSRQASGLLADVIHLINASKALVVSIDIPSGLFADKPVVDAHKASIVKASFTLSFQFPKQSFFFPENEQFVGLWNILDIGLHPDFIRSMDVKSSFIQQEDIKSIYKPRKRFAHKGHYGHALLIAGSKGKAGAAILASKACMASGVGLTTVYTPEHCLYPIQVSVPEAMVIACNDDNYIGGLPDLEKYDVIGVGPGIGLEIETGKTLKLLIQNAGRPLVIDADALNILADNPTWLSFLPAGSILTPHPGEFTRLAGKSSNGFERLEKAKEMAKRYNVYVLLKDAFSVLVCPDGNCYFNSTGNPGMASGGSGDVLTGIIASLLAQSYSPMHAALLAMYLHGMAGDIASRHKGFESLTASDIISNLPKAFRNMFY